jgi:hypothetical protein
MDQTMEGGMKAKLQALEPGINRSSSMKGPEHGR